MNYTESLFMKWHSDLIPNPHLKEALGAALENIQSANPHRGPDLLCLFASGYDSTELDTLATQVNNSLGEGLLLGCSAGGVAGAGHELEHQQRGVAYAAAWLPDVELSPISLSPSQLLDWVESPEDLPKRLGVDPETQPNFILIPDPFSLDPGPLLKMLDEVYPAGSKIGGLASGGRAPGENRLFLGGQTYREGLVGVSLSGNIAMDTLVAQGCRPIGQPMFLTRAQNHVAQAFDGKPAIEVLGELYQQLSPADQELFRTSLFMGIAMRGHQEEYHPGDFLIRNLAGVLPDEQGLAVGAHLQEGMVVQFHLRDKSTSAQDLKSLCRRYQMAHGAEHEPPQGALLFSCLGRGAHLYGEPHHDSKMLQEFFGPIPMGGFFCNGEIGPVHHQTHLHGYTSAVALFRRSQP